MHFHPTIFPDAGSFGVLSKPVSGLNVSETASLHLDHLVSQISWRSADSVLRVTSSDISQQRLWICFNTPFLYLVSRAGADGAFWQRFVGWEKPLWLSCPFFRVLRDDARRAYCENKKAQKQSQVISCYVCKVLWTIWRAVQVSLSFKEICEKAESANTIRFPFVPFRQVALWIL